MAGRRPKPTAQKELEGNPGKRPLNENEPKPAIGGARCPSHLSREAKREWSRIVPELERIGVLSMIDIGAIAACCQSYGRWVRLEQDIKREGEFINMPIISKQTNEPVKNENGEMLTLSARNPKVVESRQTLIQYRAYCSEFGLTPSSRSRITVPEMPDGDDDGLD